MGADNVDACICCADEGNVVGYGSCPLCDGLGSSGWAGGRLVAEEKMTSMLQDVPFEVLAIVGKGIGVRATRKILAGSLIVAEPPLLRVPGVEGLRKTISQEHPEIAAALDSESMRRENELAAADERMEAAVDKELAALSEGEAAKFLALADGFLPDSSSGGSLAGRLLTNAVSVTEEDVACVYELTSRINHSCTPNSYVAREESGLRCVFAKTDIEAGDEICISYIEDYRDSDKHGGFRDRIIGIAPALGLDADMLVIGLFRQQLYAKWGFWCTCERCSPLAEEADEAVEKLCEVFGELG
eukprot:TRINITY_DN46829_c0_g1_i1.p1 TRINITY_DN46829_c0_g1~~TRINITY_DN46829_c0_g1_i1.p1  ORF type:complete len:301 (+),score=57.79 TRINITY_DN46829_c0_g1_i1:81-983(+)